MKREFSLSYRHFLRRLWKEPCFYCDSPIETVGIDRVDNFQGYHDDNVVPCCWPCNQMKRILSVEEFIAHISKIYQNMVRQS